MEATSSSKLRVASPCEMPWDEMTGDNRTRFCDSCQHQVYNFESLTDEEIAGLLRRIPNERICGRISRDDFSPVERRNPRKPQRRWPALAALIASVLGLGDSIAAQTTTADTPSAQQRVRTQLPFISGTVTDPNGMVLSGAEVTVLKKNKTVASAKTSEKGHFEIKFLPDGTYDLRVKMNGFEKYSQEVKVAGGQVAPIDVILSQEYPVFVVGILGVDDEPITSAAGTTTITIDHE